MNYLVHLYFSQPRPLAWSGALMGDFVKGDRYRGLPDDLVRHIKLHRHLDTYARGSEPFQNSRRRIDPALRHGRSILVDVFYDHFLACQWDAYDPQPLSDFARQVYRGLDICYDFLDPQLQRQLPRMAADDWLTSYRRPEIVKRVLQRLEQRLNFRVPLAAGFYQLEPLRAQLENDFSCFMSAAADHVAQWWGRQQ